MEEKKKWYESKTIWLNLVGGIVVAAATALGDVKEIAPYVAAALSLGNFVLRFATDKPIGK